MYAPSVVDAARDRLERGLGRKLREYSQTEVMDFAYRMKDIEWSEGAQANRILHPEEQEYIINERLFCQISFGYWLERYCKILTDEKKILPLVPWPSQQRIMEIIGQEELKKMAAPPCDSCGARHPKIFIILLKSRQIGGTAISEALVAHMVFLSPNTKGLIASDHPDASLELHQTIDKMYEYLPGWMKPRRDWNVKATHMRLPDLNSGVIIGAGNQKTTLGQGLNVDVAHLTEVSTWNREMCEAVDIDLMPAFKSSHKHHSMILLESTGSGARGNWFHDQFASARAGTSLFKPVFIAWYLRPGWTNDPTGIEFSPETLAMTERVKKETGIELKKAQMAFYQVTRLELESKGKLDMFYQEFPSTIEEAFQTGLRSVFPITLRSKMRDVVRTPIGVYDVNIGERKLRPVDLQTWLADETGASSTVEGGTVPTKADNRVVVWEWAKPGYIYIVGVDASYGMAGKDAAAVEVMRVGNKWLPDEQVAEFRGTISPQDLASVAWILGSVYRDKSTALEAQMVVEVNPGSPGIVTQTELLRMGYPHFYVWQKPTRLDGGYTKEIGWYTTAVTRPLLMEMGVDYLKKGDLLINSTFFIEEMGSFVALEKQNGQRRLEHAPGYHDDRIIALFMALYVAHGDDNRSIANERRKEEEHRRKPERPTMQFQELGISWQEAMDRWEASLT